MDKPQSESEYLVTQCRKSPVTQALVNMLTLLYHNILYLFWLCANAYIITQKGRTVPPPTADKSVSRGVRRALPTYIIAQNKEIDDRAPMGARPSTSLPTL